MYSSILSTSTVDRLLDYPPVLNLTIHIQLGSILQTHNGGYSAGT